MIPAFLILDDDRLVVRADAIVAVKELDEQDIDPRTGRLALGIPEGAVAQVITERATFYTKTAYDEILQTIVDATVEVA